MAQLVEHILGKDEVPGPNPGSSSRQPRREIFGALAFLWDFCGTSEGSAFLFLGCLELLPGLVVLQKESLPFGRLNYYNFGLNRLLFAFYVVYQHINQVSCLVYRKGY